MTARSRILLVLCALAFLAVHLWSLPRALEDPDSINFALGVQSFDVAKHQPHPPGYPAYIALAKLSTEVASTVMAGADRDRRSAVGLAVLSALAGTAAVFVFAWFWLLLGLPDRLASMSAILAVASPLFWITAARPLTDVVGLVAAVAVQSGLLVGWRGMREDATRFPRAWILAAAGAGLVPGLRSQTLWLVGPLACWMFAEMVSRRRLRHAALFASLVIAGILAWLVPLVGLSGGLGSYLATLRAQGAEDFVGVEMLATSPTLDMLKFALDRTFLVPWQWPILGQVILVLAGWGLVRAARFNPRLLAALAVAFGPYLAFHLTFQETHYVRYALPLLVPIGGLVVIGVESLARRFAPIATAALVIASVWIALPDARAYGREISPLSSAVRDMIAGVRTAAERPMLTMHHPLWWSSRRTFDWYQSTWKAAPLPFPGDREWLHIVDHFREGHTNRAWLLADPKRTDTALIDHRAQTVRGRYGRAASLQRLVGGDLLENAAWLEFTPPRWMLGRGWALTPEIRGATAQDRRQPHHRAAEGWLRRDAGAGRLMIGGRYIAGGSPAELVIAIDGRELARWTVGPSPVWWVRWVDVPAEILTGEGPYAMLTAAVKAAAGGSSELAFEQFDFAPAESLMYAFGDGWQELEQNPATGRSWRWSSERNQILVFGGSDVELTLSGESPLRYFDEAPLVRVVVGGEELARFEPAADFTQTVVIPARLLANRPTAVTVETNRVWVPAERSSSPDQRRLGLRFYQVDLKER